MLVCVCVCGGGGGAVQKSNLEYSVQLLTILLADFQRHHIASVLEHLSSFS